MYCEGQNRLALDTTTMYRQLTDQAERYLRSLYQQDDIAGELKRKLADLMARGEANADAACRALKLSRRTLQRRLKAEKTSFQKILKEVRAELAINYLRDARLKSNTGKSFSAPRNI
jgi:AraC-like DNA-binding protein